MTIQKWTLNFVTVNSIILLTLQPLHTKLSHNIMNTSFLLSNQMLVNDMPTNKRNDMSTNLVLIFYFLLFRECFICFYLLYVFKKEIYTKMNDVLVNLTSGKTSKDKDFCIVCCCHRWIFNDRHNIDSKVCTRYLISVPD